MPAYPAFALLLGSAMATGGAWIKRGTRVLSAIVALAGVAAITILVLVRHVPTPGDIFSALTSNPSAYTLSLGHMEDLTLQSFAYLRMPLLVAAIAFVIGAIGTFRATGQKAFLCAALMMVLFFQAARMALVTFDPYLSSKPLAEALLHSPEGELIVDRHYYASSSVFFYTNRTGLLLNGKILNLAYGAAAPGAPDVFIDDAKFAELWTTPQRYYLVGSETILPRLEKLVARDKLNIVAESGGKFLLTNIALPGSTLPPQVATAKPLNQHSFADSWPPQRQSRLEPLPVSYRIQVNLMNAGLTSPAATPQTRYILSRNAASAYNRANSGGSSRDRVAPAVRDGSSVPVASLHCISPEEDA